MLRIRGICLAVLLILAVAFPFAQNAYQRYQVSRHLDSVMDTRERAEFRNWNGDAISFAKRLYDRCELTQGQGAVPCGRYRSAFE